jgi:hypothetical protein
MGNPELCACLFDLLGHRRTFEPACALMEELLSSHSSTLDLGRVPHLTATLLALNPRQLAQFCRVIALLIFQPEDRRLLESTKTLKSLSLLKLRRDRYATSNSMIDRNQASLIVFIPADHRCLNDPICVCPDHRPRDPRAGESPRLDPTHRELLTSAGGHVALPSGVPVPSRDRRAHSARLQQRLDGIRSPRFAPFPPFPPPHTFSARHPSFLCLRAGVGPGAVAA